MALTMPFRLRIISLRYFKPIPANIKLGRDKYLYCLPTLGNLNPSLTAILAVQVGISHIPPVYRIRVSIDQFPPTVARSPTVRRFFFPERRPAVLQALGRFAMGRVILPAITATIHIRHHSPRRL